MSCLKRSALPTVQGSPGSRQFIRAKSAREVVIGSVLVQVPVTGLYSCRLRVCATGETRATPQTRFTGSMSTVSETSSGNDKVSSSFASDWLSRLICRVRSISW